MLKLAGRVLDVHDDVGLTVFRQMLHESDREKVAEGVDLLQPDELMAIDDNRFGAIFYSASSPGEQRRAFPMHTPEHTKLSACYFVNADNEGAFPPEVRSAIAAQLSHGFDIHDIDPAEVLGEKTASEVMGWAEDHGEWAPGDNFIDVEMHDTPEGPEEDGYAFSKVASGGMRRFVLPCNSADQVRSSMEALMGPHAMDELQLDAFEMRKAASALKFSAEYHEVAVPDQIAKLACVEPRPRDDVESLIRLRVDYVDGEKRAEKSELIKTAVTRLLEEIEPVTLVSKIALFDKACGIGEHAYMKGCLRPMDVVFEAGATKEASNDEVLADLGGVEHVKNLLGEEEVAAFKVNARDAFERQSPEIKHLLRHARD